MVEEPVVNSNHNDILKSSKPFSAHPIKFYRMEWLLDQCEGKYPTVQQKVFLVKGILPLYHKKKKKLRPEFSILGVFLALLTKMSFTTPHY